MSENNNSIPESTGSKNIESNFPENVKEIIRNISDFENKDQVIAYCLEKDIKKTCKEIYYNSNNNWHVLVHNDYPYYKMINQMCNNQKIIDLLIKKICEKNILHGWLRISRYKSNLFIDYIFIDMIRENVNIINILSDYVKSNYNDLIIYFDLAILINSPDNKLEGGLKNNKSLEYASNPYNHDMWYIKLDIKNIVDSINSANNCYVNYIEETICCLFSYFNISNNKLYDLIMLFDADTDNLEIGYNIYINIDEDTKYDNSKYECYKIYDPYYLFNELEELAEKQGDKYNRYKLLEKLIVEKQWKVYGDLKKYIDYDNIIKNLINN